MGDNINLPSFTNDSIQGHNPNHNSYSPEPTSNDTTSVQNTTTHLPPNDNDTSDDSIQLLDESIQLPLTSCDISQLCNETDQIQTIIPFTNRETSSIPSHVTNSKTWKIMYANIRGLKGKRSSLIEHLNSEKPHLFLLTETLLPTNSNIELDGYTTFCRARDNGKGGGIAILVRHDINNIVIAHTSDRPIELMWVSVRRRGKPPLFIGCYYGKQETRCNKEKIDEEMFYLSEEIEEYSNEGDIIMAMDANGKVGILGEEKSRNGKKLEEVFERNNLKLLNKSQKCTGKITRQNTNNPNERSAIDFMVCHKSIIDIINWMHIDEEGILKLKGNMIFQ